YGLEIVRRIFPAELIASQERFLTELTNYCSGWSKVETAEFEIVGIEETSNSPLTVKAKIRYDLVGTRNGGGREGRTGNWLTSWKRDEANTWRAIRWEATEETVSRTTGPIFVDVTSQAVGQTESYQNQLLRGVDHWRTVLDGACGIDVYGNNGL